MTSNIMVQKNELIKPNPSEFAQYAYCGVKLMLDKRVDLDSFRHAKHFSYSLSDKTNSRLLGQKNEHKCIEWILKMHREPQQVIFDGTGKDTKQNFISIINTRTTSTSILCRPDLIIKRSNETLLYEFKAVSESRYLSYFEFDSVYAQVWCYRFIDYFKINKYFLFRYYEDPFKWGVYPIEKELTQDLMSDDKFLPLFENYLRLLEIKNNHSNSSKKDFDLSIFNQPVNQPQKCHNCIYYKIHCDPICEVKL